VTNEELRTFGKCVLVATSTWRGTAPPDLSDPALRDILHKSHHSWDGRPDVYFTADAPPPEYRLLGQIPPSEEDAKMPCNSLGGWASEVQIVLQWRWDHDREALLAEEATKAVLAEQWAAAAKDLEARRRAELTWEKLRAKTRFASWEEHVDAPIVSASRKLFADAVDGLAAIRAKGGNRKARLVLRALVEGFNRLDREHDHFVETIEREDICEEIEEVAFLAGLPGDIADEWRDW
jgi:hypothetical protein